jgi:hypothetical protein
MSLMRPPHRSQDSTSTPKTFLNKANPVSGSSHSLSQIHRAFASAGKSDQTAASDECDGSSFALEPR